MKISPLALAALSAVALLSPCGEARAGIAFVPHRLEGIATTPQIPNDQEQPQQVSTRRTGVICYDESTNRRNALFRGASALSSLASIGSSPPMQASAVTSPSATAVEPLADLPMVRLRLPPQGLGREYVAVKLKIHGKGPFDFMVDTGLSTELITPHLQQTLGIGSNSGTIQGIGAGGFTQKEALVEMDGFSLCCGKFPSTQLELPLPPLHAVVTDFPQEHIDPAHDPVEGMLGMEMLTLFDVDFDFPNNRLRLWKPGTAAAVATKAGMVEIPAAVLNETGLIGIRILSPNASGQPVLGFLDCGSTFSVMNWAAAHYLGLPPREDSSYKKAPSVLAYGVDGRPQQLPTHKIQLSYVGNPKPQADKQQLSFSQPPSTWNPWQNVQVAIGDIPAFSELLGDGKTPFTGPAALIGLDVLAQRRVIFETGRGRGRKLWVSPK